MPIHCAEPRRPAALTRRRAAAALLSACFAPARAVSGQEQHITPFTGEWRYVPERSKFDPGPPFRSFVIRFTPDGTRHLDLTFADGRRLRAELPWSDGRRVAVRVLEGEMRGVEAVSKTRGMTFEDTWFQDGQVIENVRGRLSRDRKTLIVDVEGPLAGGGVFRNQVVFERQ